MNSIKLFASVAIFIMLSACASLGTSSKSSSAGPLPDAIQLAEEKTNALEVEVARLKSENARLANKMLEIQRERDQLDAAFNDLREGEALQVLPSQPEPLIAALPQPQDNAVVETAEAPDLSATDVPVENAPRLVQPAFAATDPVFENETNGDIATSSVLFGVHLASYRKVEEAREGWRKLQRENPDQLGLLEPRLETVEVPEKGIFMRLIGGGFSSSDKAEALCGQIKGKGLFCSVVNYSGERLIVSG